MQNSKHRSGSSEIASKTSLSSPRTMQEKKMARSSEMQTQIHQLQEELMKTRDERTRALEDLEELRSNKKLIAFSNKGEMDVLEKKVEKAKESERKMLESLVAQTKQLEQTKIMLEEARLEVRLLQENGEKQSPIDMIRDLKNELKLATEAEDKSKKAMDDLAIALKEVTTENNQVKATLSSTQSELEKAKLELEQSKDLVRITNEKLRATIEGSERLELEHEDMVAKLKVYEDEIAKLKLENDKSNELLKGSRNETSKLRDILKQAVNEATIVKEALEIARNENSRLNDSLLEKDNALQSLKQEHECVKVSEAAATDSVNELKGLIDATNSSSIDATRNISESGVSESVKTMKFSSDRYLNGDSRIPKKQLFGSASNLSDSRVPSSIYDESNEYDCENGSPTREKKKKTIIKRFGDMLRRRNIHK